MKSFSCSRMFESRFSRNIVLMLSIWCLVSFLGCEAFVRKFTRKHKKEDLPREEMVITPEEYKSAAISQEELARQYFIYWKTWHEELIVSLAAGANHKKQLGSVDEVIKNLEQLKELLNLDKKEKLGIYIGQLHELKDQISRDSYGNNIVVNRQKAEGIRRNIFKNISYNSLAKDLNK